jgi:acyl-CoA thioesterase
MPAMTNAPAPDAYAKLLGIEVTQHGGGHAEARVTVTGDHLNPHGTAHGAFLYSVAGTALAAAANDDEHSGVVSAVLIDYLSPAREGDELLATAQVAERMPKEDVFVVRVTRGDDVVARATGRANRRVRKA